MATHRDFSVISAAFQDIHADEKRAANNEAYWEEQEAKANEQRAEDYRKTVERYVDFYSGLDGTPEIRNRLNKMLADAVAAERAHDDKWEEALQRLEAIGRTPVPCPSPPAAAPGPGVSPPTVLSGSPAGQRSEKKTNLQIGAGGLFGAPEGSSTPPPAGAPRPISQHEVRDVGTGMTGPGLDDIIETLELLEEIENLNQGLEDFSEILDRYGSDALVFIVVDLQARVAGFRSAVRVGFVVGIPVGSLREHTFR